MHYRELKAYRQAYQLSLEIHKLSREFPKTEQYGGLADQIRRSTKSICANMAEGLGKFGSFGEEKHGLRIALGSCEETIVWLQYCKDLEYIEVNQAHVWSTEYEEVARMLVGLMKRRLPVAA
jgi:four helix bundle protein